MLKIRIFEIEKHRNETTFRPYLQARDYFRQVGIDFVFEGTKYDLAWVGQASYINRFVSYKKSMEDGIRFVNSIPGDIILFDGQDSASLMGSFDVLKGSKSKLLLKNSLYTEASDYLYPSTMGRKYWKYFSDLGYSVDAGDLGIFDQIKLSGSNWLSTVNPVWYDYTRLEKDIDVFAMFSYPGRTNREFLHETNSFYDSHREKCINFLETLPKNIKIAKLDRGEKVPLEQYYDLMRRSKIVVAPFGYGEMAPRDVEAAMIGAVLIKPSMDHLKSIPFVYEAGKTYVDCKWDFSDLPELIENILDTWKSYSQEFYVNNFRNKFIEEYKTEKLVLHMYNLIKEMDGIGVG